MALSKQEIFDRTAAHLLAQGEPASISGDCMYRTPNGLKCAVGALIPDEVYHRFDIDPKYADPYNELEGANIESRVVQRALIDSGVLAKDFDEEINGTFHLLLEIQLAHDEYQSSPAREWPPFPVHIREKLEHIARDHKLDDTVLHV